MATTHTTPEGNHEEWQSQSGSLPSVQDRSLFLGTYYVLYLYDVRRTTYDERVMDMLSTLLFGVQCSVQCS